MWRYALGQATGSAHEKLYAPCQDRLACSVVEQTLIAVISDGAGSSKHSHVGAELAASCVSTIAQLGVRAGRTDYVEILREAAVQARKRLRDAAQERKTPLREFSCTLLAVIAAPVGGAALQVGDGAIVMAERERPFQCVFWPQKGEYFNATHFVSDHDALDHLRVSSLADEVIDIALLSDGLEALALQFAKRAAYEPFFRTAFAPVHESTESGELTGLSQSLSQMLQSPAVRARTDDDTSLILASRRAHPV